MPRVSRKKKNQIQEETWRPKYHAVSYARVSVKNGGHGREDTLNVQQEICKEYIKKKPEMELMYEISDNGISGTTFVRKGFERMMDLVRSGKINCIVVKDFSRFGRDAIESVELIDEVFPKLGIRFISILDEYDSENPVCQKDRVFQILKHFMNDYYARIVSKQLIQAHKTSREKGEFWGNRPPYGYRRSEESSKKLVPYAPEAAVVRKIFQLYVIEGKSTYEITRILNQLCIPSPAESYERKPLNMDQKRRRIWIQSAVTGVLKNPACIGALAYGKTKQALHKNIPLRLIPQEKWEIVFHVMEPIIEESFYDMAQTLLKERWGQQKEKWKRNPRRIKSANGPLVGKIYCAKCGKRMYRANVGEEKKETLIYRCPNSRYEYAGCTNSYLKEDEILETVKEAFLYQIQLAEKGNKDYGEDFYRQLKGELEEKLKRLSEKCHLYEGKKKTAFENYALGVLDKDSYQEVKAIYENEEQDSRRELADFQKYQEDVLDNLRLRIEWSHQLFQHTKLKEITSEIVENFIEGIYIYSKTEVEIKFWFTDIFEKELRKEDVCHDKR